MLVLFEVHVTGGADIDQLFSADVLAETGAQIMTIDQARTLGFGGLDALDGAENVYLVAVAAKDARFISTRLDGSAIVHQFRTHEV